MKIITTSSELAETCADYSSVDFVTVDTEFIRETTYWPKLCLIQMAKADDEVIVDPLAADIDLRPFFDLMKNDRVKKVFHAGRQDIEIIFKMEIIISHS